MPDRSVLILPDGKLRRHAVNALVGALEIDRSLDPLALRLPSSESQLESDFAAAMAEGKRPLVAVSFMTHEASSVGRFVQRLRATYAVPQPPRATPQARAIFIAGGPHPSAAPEATLALGFDLTVRGEGEAVFIELLRALTSGDAWDDVPSLTFRDASGELRIASPHPPIRLDDYPPFPLRRRRVVGPIEISRGCPFACGYCQTSQLWGTQPRHRSIEAVARSAAVIRERGLRDVRVIAPDAFAYGSPDGISLNLPALESLLAAMREAVGPEGRIFFGTFPSEVRPEHVQAETVSLLRRFADNDRLILGAQSGSDRMLRRCGRRHTTADVVAAVEHTLRAGLTPHVDFIFGLPGETDDDRKATMEMIEELTARGALIHAHTFTPLPQTRFADEPAGRIHGQIRPMLKDWIRRGKLYGDWHRQGREAKDASPERPPTRPSEPT